MGNVDTPFRPQPNFRYRRVLADPVTGVERLWKWIPNVHTDPHFHSGPQVSTVTPQTIHDRFPHKLAFVRSTATQRVISERRT